MIRIHTRWFVPVAATCCLDLLPAQMTRTVPAHAEGAECQHGNYQLLASQSFRSQLLYDAAAVAPNGALLTGMRFRADRGSLPLPALTVPNVTVTLSHSSLAPSNMSTTFASNVTDVETVVFQGSVQLPGYTVATAQPLGWDIVIPFAQPFVWSPALGNLLVELVGNNPAGTSPGYWLDAAEGGGSATRFGRGGDNPGSDWLDLVVTTGAELEPRLLTIGTAIDWTTTLLATNPPGVLALGVAPLPQPVDLAPLGAPTNTLYIDPLLLAPHSWTQTVLGWSATVTLQIPNLPTLVGERIYAQSALFDPTANALGLQLSAAMEVRLGQPGEVLPVRELDGGLPNATTGFLLDFGNLQPRYGATAVQFEGVFF